MPDPEPSDPSSASPVNRVFPPPHKKAIGPRDVLMGRPDFGDVGRKLDVLHTYQATYGMVRLKIEKYGEAPEAIRSEYTERADVVSRIAKELGDATRDALEDALASRPPRF
jgi:hypothetical protein